MPSSTTCTSEDDPQEDVLLPPEPAEDEPRSALQQAPTNVNHEGEPVTSPLPIHPTTYTAAETVYPSATIA